MTIGGVAVTPSGAALTPPARYEPFLISQATVTATDASPHTQFAIDCASATANPSWVVDGSRATCTDGRLTVLVTATTKYYLYADNAGTPCPPNTSGCAYHPVTYDQVVTVGATLRVGGQWTYDNATGTYRFYASYIWNPGTGLRNPPTNPKPSTPQDYNFSKRFVIDATAMQVGTNLIANSAWSQKWGFVAGNITDYNPTSPPLSPTRTQVEAIANAHRNPITLDPQLTVTTNDTYPASTATFVPPLTRYSVQGPDGTYRPATKNEAVCNPTPANCGPGAVLKVAGSYAWDGSDWRFLAYFIWRPAPNVAQGRIQFNQTSRLASSTTSDSGISGHYTGEVTTGDGQLDVHGPVVFDTTWTFDSETGLWDITGTWSASRSAAPTGMISGTFSGTWDPTGDIGSVPYRIQATVVLSSGSGVFCGVTGGGTFIGSGSPDPTVPGAQPPTQDLTGSFNVVTTRDTTATC